MDWTEIKRRLAHGDDEHTEFKRWEAFPSGVGRAISALANSTGGVIVLGVDDHGQIIGVPGDPERIQEQLTSFLHSGLSAPIIASLGREHEGAEWVHWIEVRRTRGPEPVRFDRRVYLRRGRASVEPSAAELQELYNAFGFVLTEEQYVPGTTAGDIELSVFEEFLRRQGLELIADPQPEKIQDLENRGVIVADGAEHRVTLYGLLCFGRQPQSFPPTRSQWIELVAYAGTDRAADVLVRGEAKGRVDEQVERAVGWVMGLAVRESYSGLQRIDRPLLPMRALREAVVNAVAHRDYAILGSKILLEVYGDRLEITSPGELPNHMTAAAVIAGGHPRSRNESIAHYLLVKGLMEMRGRGLPLIRHEMRSFNSSEPVLANSVEGRFVRLTLTIG